MFLDGPRCREAAPGSHVLPVNSRAASRINSAPGMTSINANSKKEVMATKIMRC